MLFSSLFDSVARPFRHTAENRKLTFDAQLDPNLDRSMITDAKRLQQVLKNLLSNAFKFTEHGGVRLSISKAAGGWSNDHPTLSRAPSVVAFEVADTGVGIPAEKQKIIFEAFQQADASTSRKFGGTGLGLAISRELASLLGGEIQLRSTVGQGSTFTLYLPLNYAGPTEQPQPRNDQRKPRVEQLAHANLAKEPEERVPDDRASLEPGDRILLVVEDDPNFARIVAETAREHGLKVLVAHKGAEALALAREYQPSAVSLDIFLPDMLGWSVLSQLKQDPLTRHIPVQIVTLEDDRQHGLARGAFSFITKPSSTEGLGKALDRITEFTKPRRRTLLVVEGQCRRALRHHRAPGP